MRKDLFLITIICLTALFAQAQDKAPTSPLINGPAKSAVGKPDLTKLIAAVEANPNSHEAVSEFLYAAKDDLIIEKYYKKWIVRFPKVHNIPFTIGENYRTYQNPKAKKYLLDALAIKPNLAQAWYLLSGDATLGGDTQASRGYLEKAMQTDNDNDRYPFEYAFSFRTLDNPKYLQLTLNAIRRFPESEKGAQALHWLATDSKDLDEKKMYFDLLYKRYIDKRSPSLEEGMDAYYVLLLDTDPAKALDLATNMYLGMKQNWGHWPRKIKVAKQFRDARLLLAENKAAEALELLNSVDLGKYYSMDHIAAKKELLFFRARAADQAGQTQAAYDSLAFKYSRVPEDALGKAMLGYGAKLGKDSAQVFNDIWALRDSSAVKATEFSLKNYLKDEVVSLSDFRGKIVLVSYWFPACAPCRREFPHIENVLKKVNNQDLVYLGVNTIRDQDDYVIPMIQKAGYTFIPLKDEPFKDKGTLQALGAPTNYLIDEDGNIIFKNFIIGDHNERTLELMINEMMKRQKES